MYVAEGDDGDNQIVRYEGTGAAFPVAGSAASDNHGRRSFIGNAGVRSYFANLAFDAAGNLWATDYQNHRVVVFDAANLDGTNTFHVLANPAGAVAVDNTVVGLNGPTKHVFAEPGGADFDAVEGNLWVANNNDGNGLGNLSTDFTSLVQLTKRLQEEVLGTAAGGTLVLDPADANKLYAVYQVPPGSRGRPQFGGVQVDRAARRLYVNEQVGLNGRAYDLDTLAATPPRPRRQRAGDRVDEPGQRRAVYLLIGSPAGLGTARHRGQLVRDLSV